MKNWKYGLLIAVLITPALAQVPPASKVAIPLEVQVDRSTTPARAILRWRHDPEFQRPYTIGYRQRATDLRFTQHGILAPSGDSILQYTIDINEGTLYEVAVVNTFTRTINGQQLQFTAAGYACVGYDIPIPPFRGRVALVIDSSLLTPLTAELSQLEEDLDREGWRTERIIVPRAEQFNADAVRRTRDSIRAWYHRGNPDEPASVFLIGRIAVPYSGLYYEGQYVVPPDGHHPDHRGAWPCDGYYGCLSDIGWTDDIADTAGVVRPENRNLPGDGKFDNVFFPSPVEIRIGRVDFYNLPRLTPQGASNRDAEITLLRDYLARDHAYRTGLSLYRWAGLIDDNFPTYPELFARSGWMSFPPIVGISNVRAEKWFPTLDTSSRLLAYGCGAGSYTSANGIGSVSDFASRRVNAAFTMLFGSYFGDWDSQNNLMRVNLARGALTCSWSGRPVWYLHPMAAGETIGDITRMVQNFSPFTGQSVYVPSNAQGWIHVALLGDPTLRIRFGSVPAPRQLTLRQEGRTISIEWQPPFTQGDSVVGYYVYRTLPNGREIALTPEPITETRFTDTYRTEGVIRYAVRTVGRLRTPSGTIWDLSPAVRSDIFTTSVGHDDSPSTELTVDVTPQPVGDAATITLGTTRPTIARIEIRTLDGRLIGSPIEQYVADVAYQTISTQALAPGVYILVVRTETLLRTKPFVVIH